MLDYTLFIETLKTDESYHFSGSSRPWPPTIQDIENDALVLLHEFTSEIRKPEFDKAVFYSDTEAYIVERLDTGFKWYFFDEYSTKNQELSAQETILEIERLRETERFRFFFVFPRPNIFKEEDSNLTVLQRFISLLSVDKKDILYVYLYAIVTGLVTLTLPLGIQAIFNNIMGGQLSTSWIVLIIIVIIGTAMAGFLQILQLSIIETLQQRIFTRASLEFAFRIPRLKIESLSKYYPPELINRFFDVMTIQKGISKILMDFTTAALQIIFGLLLLAFYHPFFVFFGLFLLFFLIAIFYFTGPPGLKTSLKESDFKYKVAHWLEELARTISTFKLAGNIRLPLVKANDLVKHYLIARKKHFRILILQYANIVGFKTVVTAGLLIIGSILVVEREISPGQFVASEIIIILIINSVEKLIMSMETIYDVLTGTAKISKVTDIPLERVNGIKSSFIAEDVCIKLKDLCFKTTDGKAILKNVSLELNSKEHLAVTGSGGSGKTSLLNVMAGLYTGFTGSYRVNDIPFQNINLGDYRSLMGDNLSQEEIFEGSMIENLCMRNPKIQFPEIQRTCELVKLTDFINNLPNAFETHLNPNDNRLPSSIKQKIILVRCLVHQPRIVFMDGFLPTVNKSERQEILNNLFTKTKGGIVIATNSRLVAEKCDNIIVLDKGEVVAEGSYEEIKDNDKFKSSLSE